MNVDVNPKFRFDGTINLGHILTIISLLTAGFLAYTSIETRIDRIDVRTSDYVTVRDLVRDNRGDIDRMQGTVELNAQNTKAILDVLSKLREDVAAIKASLPDGKAK